MHKEELNFGSHTPPDPGIFGYSSTLRDGTFLRNLAHISRESDRIFMKIFSQMYPSTRKVPLHFGSNPDPESVSGYELCIRTIFSLADVCGLRLLLFVVHLCLENWYSRLCIEMTIGINSSSWGQRTSGSQPRPVCGKMPYFAMLKCTRFTVYFPYASAVGHWSLNCCYSGFELIQFSDLCDPEVDDCRNLITFSLSAGTYLVKFFMNIQSLVLTRSC